MKKINSKLDEQKISEMELGAAWEFLNVFDSIFGFIQSNDFEISQEIEEQLNKRNQARLNKNWAESDSIRKSLHEKGWIVEDTHDGQKIKKA
jgi:cysteinyl-tRNA synthetase